MLATSRVTSRALHPAHQVVARRTRRLHPRASSASNVDDDSSRVNYFAYGSNINPSTFQGVRNMKPTASVPCVLRDYELVFNVPGVPYVEPAFASVRAAADVVTHGVSHAITLEEWEYLVTTEGSYDVVDVTCTSYTGEEIKCKTLTHRTLPNFGEQLPSLRYLTLLRDGARHYSLSDDWIKKLDEIEAYEPVEIDVIGRAAIAMSIGPDVGGRDSDGDERGGEAITRGRSARRRHRFVCIDARRRLGGAQFHLCPLARIWRSKPSS
jgi:hypothetical protein